MLAANLDKIGGTAPNSPLKTKSPTKAAKSVADQPEGETPLVIASDADIAGAFAAEKLMGDVDSDIKQVSDYYRYGAQGAQGGVPRGIASFAHDDKEASIRIITENTKTDILPPYTKFILESVQEAHSERQQIVETFGDFYVFMFGERPPIYNYGGSLINTRNVNWVNDFMLLYERYFRGTRCTEQKTRVLLTYGGRQVEGYIINTSNQTAASSQEAVNFSFQVIVTSRKILGVSSDFGADLSAFEGSSSLGPLLAQIGVPGILGSSDPVASQANKFGGEIMSGLADPFSIVA